MDILDKKAWSYLCDINSIGAKLCLQNNQKIADNTSNVSIHFTVDSHNFLIHKDYIETITTIPEITNIPQQQGYISGLANMQNSLVVIIDLKYLLFTEPSKLTTESRILLLNIENNIPVALLVENLCGKLQLEQQLAKYDLITNPPLTAMAEFVDVAYTYNNNILYNFNANNLLESKKFLA